MLAWVRWYFEERHFGEAAYDEARNSARPPFVEGAVRPGRRDRHWDRVRREIGRRAKRNPLDTATRYLNES